MASRAREHVYIAPRSQAALVRLQDRLKTAQASFEVQPRVFYEGFPKAVLYVQDVKSASGAAIWKGVFLADVSSAVSPRITLAEQGILVSEGPDRLHLHLRNGSTHETDPKNPDHYQISTFDQTDIPIPVAKHRRETRARAYCHRVFRRRQGSYRLLAHKIRSFVAGTTLNSTDGLRCRPPA